MKIACAQLRPIVGAFEQNADAIAAAYERALAEGAQLCLTSELSTCGYPPHDLVYREEFHRLTEQVLERLQALTRGRSCALAVGHLSRHERARGRAAQNSVSVFAGGERIFLQHKSLLPTYDVFDEARYFEPGTERGLFEFGGYRIALGICEDFWAQDPELKDLYGQDPVEEWARLKPDLVISVSASPFESGKWRRRERLHAQVAERMRAPLIYVNQAGATDEILFDGGSFALNPGAGTVVGRLAWFESDFGSFEVQREAGGVRVATSGTRARPAADGDPGELELLERALVSGISEYFARTGFRQAILGLSGGIDSAVVAVLAARSLGASNVLAVAMPSQYSSPASLEDAQTLATALGIGFEVRPIKFAYATLARGLAEGVGELSPIALENLQARLRALTLLTLANHSHRLVLTTGNKSELAQGYCTQYGDMVGALAPIGDLYKTRVYELARSLGVIPERTLTRPPSAELKPGQTDQDTLPPYDILDRLLEDYVERNRPASECIERHTALWPQGGGDWVVQCLARLEQSEFKRRQAAPVLKVSAKAFGIGRRVPIAKRWTVA